MGKVRILEIKESVFADNGRQADQLRIRLKEKGVFLMNLMSSPGSGKTTTLKRTIAALKDDLVSGSWRRILIQMWMHLQLPKPGQKQFSCIQVACVIWMQNDRAGDRRSGH